MSQLTPELQNLISASLLRLRMKSPFFATLSLFTTFRPTSQIPFAATDGKDIFFNPAYVRSLPSPQQDGLLLHEVLHAALMHVLRRGLRDGKIWNIAADIVVNGMIAQQGGFELPPGGLRHPQLEHLSVEEIYEKLQQDPTDGLSLPNSDLLDEVEEESAPQTEQPSAPSQNPDAQGCPSPQGTGTGSPPTTLDREPEEVAGNRMGAQDTLSQHRKAALEAHWRAALHQAAVIARTTQQGLLPAGIERELGLLTEPQLDWRSHLWRYLVQTPTDFSGFDRRFVGRGLYLEALVGESVQVYVAVDTSGSIYPEQLRLFLSEVQGIFESYPHLHGELYYVDAAIYGPFSLDINHPLPQPQGGGGTSFVPFFEAVGDRSDPFHQGVCVYLTDGYGTFPDQPPPLPVLWVVTPGGLDLRQFPFGEAVRLLMEF